MLTSIECLKKVWKKLLLISPLKISISWTMILFSYRANNADAMTLCFLNEKPPLDDFGFNKCCGQFLAGTATQECDELFLSFLKGIKSLFFYDGLVTVKESLKDGIVRVEGESLGYYAG
jgi:hypothetical protein